MAAWSLKFLYLVHESTKFNLFKTLFLQDVFISSSHMHYIFLGFADSVPQWSPDSSVGIATSYALDGQSSIPVRGKIFLFSTPSGPAVVSTQPPSQWVPGPIFLGVKRPGFEADHSPPSSAEVNSPTCLHTGKTLPYHAPQYSVVGMATVWTTEGLEFESR
jgi:hypothetical protein